MVISKGVSITEEKEGYTEESMMFTYSPGEEEQNKINAVNASLLEKVQFVQWSPKLKRELNLDFIDVSLYGYICFFSYDGENVVHLTNEQLAYILSTSESSIKRSLKTLKDKGLIEYTLKTFSDGHKIKSVRKVKLTPRVPIVGQIDPPVVGQIDPQLITMVKNTISKDIDKTSYKDNPINLLSKVLIEKYPIDISGITDRRMLNSLVKVCGPRKGRDEWMDKDWKVNFSIFLKEYLKNTEERFLVRSVARLKDLVKDWRERGGSKKASRFQLVN